MRFRTLRRTYARLIQHEGWNVGLVSHPISAFLDPDFRPVISWCPSPGLHKFLADPFVAVRDGRTYVLCEEFDYTVYRGRIVCFEVDRTRVTSFPEVVMDFRHHVSYPYLLNHNDAYYCIPETARANEISLYKAEDFPRNWRKVKTLVRNFSGIDPTVFQYGRFWWLACTDLQSGPNDKLYMWYANDLFGPWKSHRANPVKIDRGSARSAGTPFRYKGRVYRPAQDLSYGSYGRQRIVINRLVKLTPSEFQEEAAAVVTPSSERPYPDAIHTLSSATNNTIVDGNRFRFISELSELNRSLQLVFLELFRNLRAN
jgi:hypothetical protein